MDLHYSFIIVGAGPAGVQLAYFFTQKKLDYLLLEQEKIPGAFYQKFPIHRTLLSINKKHTGYKDAEKNLRWDWNSLLSDDYGALFTDYTDEYFPNASALVKYIKDFVKKYKINVNTQKKVVSITKKNGLFYLSLGKGVQLTCECLIIATGLSKPYIPDIPGVRWASHYADLTLDKKPYVNKRVLILGKGNSGFEVADYLTDTTALTHIVSPHHLEFAWKTHFIGHLRAVNNNFLDTYQLKSLNAVLNADVEKIEKKGKQFEVTFRYHFASGEVESICYDHVILATGFRMDCDIFGDHAKPELFINKRLPKMKSHFESSNIHDMYFAGTLMQSRDFKREQSSFIHGFRYNVKFLANYLGARYGKKSFPKKRFNASIDAILKKIITQVNRSSALWQQTGYLCDVILLNEDAKKYTYLETLPVDFVKDGRLVQGYYLMITLEFGQEIIDQYPDVFRIERVERTDYKHAHLSTFLHPIIRLFHDDKLMMEHHIVEDFAAVWQEPEHIKPLKEWLKTAIRYVNSLHKITV